MRQMRGRRWVLVGSLAGVLACTTATQDVDSAGWSLVWGDEFDGAVNTGVASADWLYDLGTSYPGEAPNWGTGEVEIMTDSVANVSHDGVGHLLITPLRGADGAWTSGRIETRRNDFQPAAGGVLAVEASIRQPNVSTTNGLGYWPAFWMLGGPFRGQHASWPSVGEIDILENINGRSSVFSTFHCGSSIPGPCNEPTGMGSGERPCPNCLSDFHTYRVEWDRSKSSQELRWYLDGTNYFTLNANQVDAASWAAATGHGYMIILNVAIGGGFPAAFGGGPTVNTVSGSPMVIDYVRVYQR